MKLRRASNSASTQLGQVLGRGGEGTVHLVNGAPRLVAKIYKKPPDAHKADKLRCMVRGQSSALRDVAAWPVDLLLDESGAVRGFLMERISARQDAHRLYSPKSRRRTFPNADFRFLVRSATNLARAFAQVHAAGHVIGDVNHGNALIGKDGTAALIDCDSFQIADHGRVFACDVGSPLFTAPELQGKAFRGLRREITHDCFGLGVLLFHLLFQGRHPFAGRHAHGDLSLERAIAESRFAYGAGRAALGMEPPPGTLPLNTFGEDLASLFERAFAPPGQGTRPAATEWIEPLRRLEDSLSACAIRPRHFHPPGPGCCWCVVENATGARLFDSAEPLSPDAEALSASQLWEAIEGVPPPIAEVVEPDVVVEHERQYARKGEHAELKGKVTGLVLAALFILGMAAPPEFNGAFVSLAAILGGFMFVALFSDGEKRHGQLRGQWDAAVRLWKTQTSAANFFRAKAKLAARLRELRKLDEALARELERIQREHAPRQHAVFLDSFEIDKAQFSVVSRSHVEILMARGIRSAGDVKRKQSGLENYVPKAAARELREWAGRCAAAYVFDPTDLEFLQRTAPYELRRQQERTALFEELRRGPDLLAGVRADIEQARIDAEAELRAKHREISKQIRQ